MKLHKLLISAMAMCTLLVECTEPEPEVEEPNLTLSTTEVDATAEGGIYTVEYTLENPTANGKLMVTPEYDWVSDIDTSVDGKISFKVAASYEEERTCRLDVSYPGVYPSSTILVRQAKGMEHSIDLVVKEVNATTIKMDVLPKDKNLSYVFILGNGKYIEENGLMEDDDALWASDMDIFQGFADAFGVDVQSAMSAFMYSGEKIDHTFTGVSPSTKYVAYAYGFDVASMTPTTEICRVEITTRTINDYVVNFDFNVEVSGLDVVIDIEAINYDGPFFFGAFDANSCPESMPDDEFRHLCELAWEQEKGLYSSFFETPEQGLHFIFKELAYYKSAHLETDLLADTEYVLWAFGMDNEAMLNTTPQRYYFRTGKAKPSSNELTLSVSDIKSRKATVKVETTNDDSYVAMLTTPDRYEGLSDEDIMTYITQNYSLNYNNGTMSEVATGLTPSTEYMLLAFGCEGGSPTTDLYKLNFTTDEIVYADYDMEVYVKGYYDINEVIALDPSWSAYAGDYVIVSVGVNADSAAKAVYFSAMYSADFEFYSYETLVAGLVNEGAYDGKEAVFVLEYDIPFTLFGVTEDNDGNYSEMWQSKPTTFTFEGRSDASEYVNGTRATDMPSMVYVNNFDVDYNQVIML